MKKIIIASLLFLMSTLCLLKAEAAVVTHLNVDFSNYTLGSVKTQTGGAGGAWTGGAAWTGTVVSVTGYVAGTQALEVYKTAGSSAGRGSVPMNTSLSLASADKIYLSVDLYAKATNGTLEIALSNGSFGTPPNLGFGFFLDTTSKAVSFTYGTTTSSVLRAQSLFVPIKDTWYRFEFEITQGATAGTGTFSVFISGGTARTAIIRDQAYTFTTTSFPTLNVVPSATGSDATAVAVNNIIFQSGLTDFPTNPLPGSGSIDSSSLVVSLVSRYNTAVQPVSKGLSWEAAFHSNFVAQAQAGNIDVLFIGDSITQYWGDPNRGLPVWEREFAPLKAANFGINSDRIQHVLWRLLNGEGSGFSPKVVVLLIGTNNTTPRNTTPEVIEGVTAVVKVLQQGFPETKILLLGILPRNTKDDPRRLQIIEINQSLAKLNDARRVFYLDIGDNFLNADGEIPVEVMDDALHPTLQGYEIFAAAIKGPLNQLLAP